MNNYIGEIRVFAGSYAPADWALCNGALLNINDNPTLYQLIGTTYGGDGSSNFALPDLRSRVVVGQGAGPGLQSYSMGTMAGAENVTLTSAQLPPHQHPFNGKVVALKGGTAQNEPKGAYFGGQGGSNYASKPSEMTLAANAVVGLSSPTGGGQSHPNIQPVLPLNYIIALTGIYPSQD